MFKFEKPCRHSVSTVLRYGFIYTGLNMNKCGNYYIIMYRETLSNVPQGTDSPSLYLNPRDIEAFFNGVKGVQIIREQDEEQSFSTLLQIFHTLQFFIKKDILKFKIKNKMGPFTEGTSFENILTGIDLNIRNLEPQIRLVTDF